MKSKALLLLIVTTLPLCAWPQPSSVTLTPDAAIAHAKEIYQKAMKVQARLYNGRRYTPPEHDLEQHPYFRTADWMMGNVFYDGEYFKNVPLMLDLHSGSLIVEHVRSAQPIQLVPEKLQYFDLAGHHFEKIINDSVKHSLPASGFYDILYDGDTRLIAYRQKTKKTRIEAGTVDVLYNSRDRYYMLKNGAFFPIKGKGTALKLMSDKKQDLKRFLKSQNIRNREILLTRLAEHYDQVR